MKPSYHLKRYADEYAKYIDCIKRIVSMCDDTTLLKVKRGYSELKYYVWVRGNHDTEIREFAKLMEKDLDERYYISGEKQVWQWFVHDMKCLCPMFNILKRYNKQTFLLTCILHHELDWREDEEDWDEVNDESVYYLGFEVRFTNIKSL